MPTPLGFLPQLPDTVLARSGQNVSTTSSTEYEGCLLNVYTFSKDSGADYAIKNMPFASRDAAKAYTIAHGYSTPWTYFGESLPARDAYKALDKLS